FTPAVVANQGIEAKLYGPGSSVIRAAEHEGRIDLWTGLASSPVAVTLRDKRNYLDLTGLARLRWMVRTNSIHTLYPVVKLANGRLLVGNRAITTNDEFYQGARATEPAPCDAAWRWRPAPGHQRPRGDSPPVLAQAAGSRRVPR